MTLAIADTDILSTFGKLGRIDLLHKLFPKICVAPAVYRELGMVERLGFSKICCGPSKSLILTDYVGTVLRPPNEAAINRLCNQLS